MPALTKQSMQANLPAVNEAVNNLLIEEEDFTSLRESISTYDAFDQIGLASRLESHELLEFRRTAAAIYKNNQRWRKAIALAKQDHLYKVICTPGLLRAEQACLTVDTADRLP